VSNPQSLPGRARLRNRSHGGLPNRLNTTGLPRRPGRVCRTSARPSACALGLTELSSCPPAVCLRAGRTSG
jgi:hypothetical protein